MDQLSLASIRQILLLLLLLFNGLMGSFQQLFWDHIAKDIGDMILEPVKQQRMVINGFPS